MNTLLDSLRHLKHGTKRFLKMKLIELGERAVLRKTNGIVISGIFSGTRLINRQVFGSKIPKFLGSYEKELHGYLAAAIDRKPQVICNIGAAEGYYALGLARQDGVKKVIAYEALESGRALISENAKLNAVEEVVHLLGKCDEDQLGETLTNNNIDLILIDIEGAELEILNQKNISLLESTELLIESHDFCQPDCLEILKSKFRNTHELQVIRSLPRTASDFTINSWLPNTLKKELMDEMRPGEMSWLVCIPKTARSSDNATP